MNPIQADVSFCIECRKEVAPEDSSRTHEGEELCNWCRPDYSDTFHCEGECNTVFESKGIPTECPKCGSYNVRHSYPDTCRLIAEKQSELLKAMVAAPLETPEILEKMRMGL